MKFVAYMPGGKRANRVAKAMATGARLNGWLAEVLPVELWKRSELPHVGGFYGLAPPRPAIREAYIAAGRTVIMADIGYWGREIPGAGLDVYHKLCLNSSHPNLYMQHRKHDDARMGSFHYECKPRRAGGEYILLSGLTPKAAGVLGYAPLEWETMVYHQLRAVTDRPIMLRFKPGRDSGHRIPGTLFSPGSQPFQEALRGAHCVVVRHSNLAMDAIINGVPAVCLEGCAASPVSGNNVEDVIDPPFPTDAERWQWLCDLSYTQWTLTEIERGAPFFYFIQNKMFAL